MGKTDDNRSGPGGCRRALPWLGGLLGLLVLLAIALPSYLRSRMVPGESPVIGNMRNMIAGMQTYAARNGGFYDGRLECLSRPWDGCIPGYEEDAPAFLGEDITDLRVTDGYLPRFHPGPDAPAEAIEQADGSPTSVLTWAYTAIPENETSGVRSFCAEDTGRICFRADGEPFEIVEGRCPPDCTLLQ